MIAGVGNVVAKCGHTFSNLFDTSEQIIVSNPCICPFRYPVKFGEFVLLVIGIDETLEARHAALFYILDSVPVWMKLASVLISNFAQSSVSVVIQL